MEKGSFNTNRLNRYRWEAMNSLTGVHWRLKLVELLLGYLDVWAAEYPGICKKLKIVRQH